MRRSWAIVVCWWRLAVVGVAGETRGEGSAFTSAVRKMKGSIERPSGKSRLQLPMEELVSWHRHRGLCKWRSRYVFLGGTSCCNRRVGHQRKETGYCPFDHHRLCRHVYCALNGWLSCRSGRPSAADREQAGLVTAPPLLRTSVVCGFAVLTVSEPSLGLDRLLLVLRLG
jgi:hypothetical protein